jgi:MFS family permease
MHSRQRLRVLCAASLCWAFSFGLGAPVASLWLEDAGHGAKVIGLSTGLYYLGIAVAAGTVPWLMGRYGRQSLVAGTLATAVTVAWFPWGGGLSGWLLLRFANGVAGAMSLIPLETLVNHNAAPECRSRDFGYYAFCVALGIGLGTLIGLPLYGVAPRTTFVVGGLVSVLAAVIVQARLVWPDIPREGPYEAAPLHFRRNFLSYGSAWSQGFLEGAMVSLLPVYLRAIGLSESGVGGLMGSTVIGVIVFLVPVSWLADRLGRRRVLLGCHVVTVWMLATLYLGVNLVGLSVGLFLAGACSSALYPLGLSILGERTVPAALARANAWFLGINCVGSLVGPIIAGVAMDSFGKQAMFLAGEAAVAGVLVIWTLMRVSERLRRICATPIPTASLGEHRETA